MPAKKKTEESSLGLASFMDKTEISGFPVREWTTEQFCQLYPLIKTIIDKLMDAGATLDSFKDGFLQNHLPVLTDAIIPIMPELIQVSCPENTEEDFKKLPWPIAIQLTMAILKRNVESLADFFCQDLG